MSRKWRAASGGYVDFDDHLPNRDRLQPEPDTPAKQGRPRDDEPRVPANGRLAAMAGMSIKAYGRYEAMAGASRPPRAHVALETDGAFWRAAAKRRHSKSSDSAAAGAAAARHSLPAARWV